MVCSAEISRRNGSKSNGAITERGKAIASRNATKHGLLAEKPSILASEDLETFQGIMQALVDQYQPLGALEWHFVQTIGMCIQRQHRVWAAEAAIGNAELLPPVPKPYTEEKYPTQTSISFELGNKAEYHPENLQLERKLLTNFLEQYPFDHFPSGLRSKYWADSWESWRDSVEKSIKELLANYPIDRSECIGNEAFYRFIRESNKQNHPHGKSFFFLSFIKDDCPTSKYALDYRRLQFKELLDCYQLRLQKIDEIELEIQQENERYQQELEERRLLTTNPIPSQIALISRYESHISKQLQQAIAQLSELQAQRKT